MLWWILALSALSFLAAAVGCCCSTCEISSDDFAVDNLATDWDIRSGTPTVSGGKLNPSAGTNLLINNTAADASTTAVLASIAFTGSNASDVGRVIIAYTDDSNYWFCEGQPGAANGTIKLFQRLAGVNTQRGSTTTVTGWTTASGRTLKICYGNGFVTATASGVGVPASVVFATTVTVASTQAGVGASETGTITLDDFTFSKHYYYDSTCPGCAVCSFCDDGDQPEQVQVEVDGFLNTDGIGGCIGVCASLNATYILDRYQGLASCCWYVGFTQPGIACSYRHALLTLTATELFFDLGFFLNTFGVPCDGMSSSGTNSVLRWKKTTPSTDCRSWSAYDLPTESELGGPTQSCADVTDTNATVTSL